MLQGKSRCTGVGGRVYFALQRKMLNPPIARLPAILLVLTNRPSGETDYIYDAKACELRYGPN